jgi:hypothetical protein
MHHAPNARHGGSDAGTPPVKGPLESEAAPSGAGCSPMPA